MTPLVRRFARSRTLDMPPERVGKRPDAAHPELLVGVGARGPEGPKRRGFRRGREDLRRASQDDPQGRRDEGGRGGERWQK